MASNPHRKLVPGQRLETIPAVAWNGFIDVANAFREGRLGEPRQRGGFDRESARTLVQVKNMTGSALDRFSVLRITGPMIDPGDNAQHFKNRPALQGNAPNASLYQPFVILQEPIGADRIGLGLLSGISAVTIDLLDTLHDFARPIDGDVTKLESSLYTGIRIVWVDRTSGTGDKLAYVLVGDRQPERSFIAKCLGTAAGGLEVVSNGVIGTFTIMQRAGDIGDETESATDIDAFVRRGLCIEGGIYEIASIIEGDDCQFEVRNPALFFVGKADGATAKGSSGDVTVWSPYGGSHTTGLTIACEFPSQSVENLKWCGAHWYEGVWYAGGEC